MGWTFDTEANHIQNIINDKMLEADAFAVHVAGEPLSVTERNIVRDNRSYGLTEHDYIEVWYLAESAKDGKPYIGLLLLDYESKGKLNKHNNRMIINMHGDGAWSYSSPLVQVWGCKWMDASMQPFYYGCPPEFLDRAPARSRYERKWYDKVRNKAQAPVVWDSWNSRRRRAGLLTLDYEPKEFDTRRTVALERIAHEHGVSREDLFDEDTEIMRDEWENLCDSMADPLTNDAN